MLKRTTLLSVAIATFMLVAVAAVPLMAVTGQDGSNGQSALPANDKFESIPWDGSGTQLSQEELLTLFEGLPDPEPLFGALNNSDGQNTTGKYIMFEGDQESGTMMNYSMNVSGEWVTILNEVNASGFEPNEWMVSGPLFTAASDNLTIFAHDNPMSTLHMVGNNTSVNLTLSSEMNVAPMSSQNPDVQAFMVTGNGITAGLVVHNGSVSSGSAENGTGYTVDLEQNGSLVWRAVPLAGGFPAENELMLIAQMANWTVEGEMAVMSADNTTFWYTTETGTMVPSVSAQNGSVMVELTAMANASGGSENQSQGSNGGSDGGGIQLPSFDTCPPAGTGGAMPAAPAPNGTMTPSGMPLLYVIAIDKNTVNPENGTMNVTVDGQNLTAATSPDQLMSGEPVYWMYEGTNASKIVVPIPAGNDSVSIEITEGEGGSSPDTSASIGMGSMTVAAVAIIGVVALIGGLGYVLRRK